MGMQKCGTGALKEFLRRNPFLGYSREGECHFFDRNTNYQQGYEYYLNLQPEVDKEVMVFDKTPSNGFLAKILISNFSEFHTPDNA